MEIMWNFVYTFYKNSTSPIFTFTSNTIVYFKKHLAYQVYIETLGNEVSTAIKCSVPLPQN